MRAREKRVCQNPNHPFKQDWYWYSPSTGEFAHLDNPKYCSSCHSYITFLKTIIRCMFMPTNTLYGNADIKTDPEQIKQLVDEVANGR